MLLSLNYRFKLNTIGGYSFLIVPNTYILGLYFLRLKEELLKQVKLIKIVDFGLTSVFEDPNVFSSIFIGIKSSNIYEIM